MSMNRASIIALALFLLALGPHQQAYAQGRSGGDRFFSEDADPALARDSAQDAAPEGARIDGSLTSTTFVNKDLGGSGGDVRIDDPSPQTRLFTDLRGKLAARNLLGGSWSARADTRVRVANPCELASIGNGYDGIREANPELDDCRFQSGTYGGNEYEIRELYVARTGGNLELKVGRQYVPEVAATKVDGARVQYNLSQRWQVLGFGGLYPARISRSLLDDYQGQVLPGVVGMAGAYRYRSLYGAIGAAGILPGGNDDATGEAETPRTFVSSNGYWRPSGLLDVYHYTVVDFTGAAGAGITNLSLGVNVKPTRALRITAALHRADTETLTVYAQDRLEESQGRNVVQNNLEVSRISSESARLGVSAALKERRFEVSTQLAVRCPADLDGTCALSKGKLDGGQAEVLLSFVDRRSLGGWRLGASISRIFGLGDGFHRSHWLAARAHGSHGFMNERLVVDADLGYLYSQDAGTDGMCPPGTDDPLSCYGASTVNTISGSSTVYYRFDSNWFALLSAVASMQSFTTALGDEPATNMLLSGLARAAYRF